MSNAAKSLDAPERTAGGVWDNPMQTDGFEFVEFTSPQPVELGRLFETLGFTAVARHRSKNVTLYRQGDVNFILHAEREGFPQAFTPLHGPPVRSEERRVGNAWVSTCRSRVWPYT